MTQLQEMSEWRISKIEIKEIMQLASFTNEETFWIQPMVMCCVCSGWVNNLQKMILITWYKSSVKKNKVPPSMEFWIHRQTSRMGNYFPNVMNMSHHHGYINQIEVILKSRRLFLHPNPRDICTVPFLNKITVQVAAFLNPAPPFFLSIPAKN